MRKLATIKQIKKIEPIKDADKIEVAIVDGWRVVVEKNAFEEGEIVVYCEVDSLLPLDNPNWEFLKGRSTPKSVNIDGVEHTGYRLKTIRLRGELSQGLILPLSVIPCTDETLGDTLKIGEDVSERLGIVKWEAPIPAQLSGKVKGQFPSFIPKTDEERVQNIPDVLEKYESCMMVVTEKIDGTSTTYYKNEGNFGVCSRNLELMEMEGNTQWKIARDLRIEEKLPDGYAIQGEIIGEGIQGNPLKQQGQKFFAFNVFDIKGQKYLDFEEMEAFLKSREIPMVPVLTTQFVLVNDVPSLIKMADGISLLCETAEREGLVFRPLKELRTKYGRLSFKSISNKYLLKHDQ